MNQLTDFGFWTWIPTITAISWMLFAKINTYPRYINTFYETRKLFAENSVRDGMQYV